MIKKFIGFLKEESGDYISKMDDIEKLPPQFESLGKAFIENGFKDPRVVVSSVNGNKTIFVTFSSKLTRDEVREEVEYAIKSSALSEVSAKNPSGKWANLISFKPSNWGVSNKFIKFENKIVARILHPGRFMDLSGKEKDSYDINTGIRILPELYGYHVEENSDELACGLIVDNGEFVYFTAEYDSTGDRYGSESHEIYKTEETTNGKVYTMGISYSEFGGLGEDILWIRREN